MTVIGEVDTFPKTQSIEWKIKDFSLSGMECKPYWSPVFSLHGESWNLVTHLNAPASSDSPEYDDSLCLVRNSDGSSINVKISVGIKTINGEKQVNRDFTKVFEPNESTVLVIPQFISKAELVKRWSELVPSGTLTFICSMMIVPTTGNESITHINIMSYHVTYGTTREVIRIDREDENIFEKVKETFGIPVKRNIQLQKWDTEWDDWVTLKTPDDLPIKAKLKVDILTEHGGDSAGPSTPIPSNVSRVHRNCHTSGQMKMSANVSHADNSAIIENISLKKMRKFAVVEFLNDENEVEVVPSNWLLKVEENDCCWWPSYRGPKLNRMLSDEDSVPDMSPGMGSIFRARILKYYASYVEAIKQIEKAEHTSCLDTESEEDQRKSRKNRKRKQMLDFISYDDLEYDDENNRIQSMLESTSTKSNTDGKSCSCDEDILIELQKIKDEQQSFQELALQKLIRIEETVADSLRIPGTRLFAPAVVDMPEFPIRNYQQLRTVEDWLNNNNNVQTLTQHFATFGGASSKDATRRILGRIMKGEITYSINWTGKNGKISLQSTSLAKVIISSVRLSFPNESEKAIEEIIKCWFRFAKDRDGGREKRRHETSNIQMTS